MDSYPTYRNLATIFLHFALKPSINNFPLHHPYFDLYTSGSNPCFRYFLNSFPLVRDIPEIWKGGGKVVNWWLQCKMQEYCCQIPVGWVWVHECNSFWTTTKRKLTSLVLYFPQSGATGAIIQDSCLFYYRLLDIHWSPEGEGRDESHQVPEWTWINCSLY